MEAKLPAAADQCLQDGRLRLPALARAVIDRAGQRMAFASRVDFDVGRSAGTRNAGAALLNARRSLAEVYVREMERSLDQPEDVAAAPPYAGTVDIWLDEGLAERLDLAHLRDAAEIACRSEQIEFEALFSGACGEHVVREGSPLRLEAHALCLATAFRSIPVRRAVRDAWFTHVGEALGIELGAFYTSLGRVLQRGGAKEAQFAPPYVGGRRFVSWGPVVKRA